MNAPARFRSWPRFAVAALVLLTLAGAYRFGIFARVGEPQALARSLVEMGPSGYAAFVLAYAVLQPFAVPGTIFIVAAPLIWPWKTAFVLSLVGTMAASVVGFSFARFVARDWVSRRIPARLQKYSALLEHGSLGTVVVLRLVFWMPQALHYLFGVSKVGFWAHFWGSLVGYTPPLLLVSYLGAEMFDASGKMQPAAWPAMAGLVVLSLGVGLAARAFERRRRPPEALRAAPDASSP